MKIGERIIAGIVGFILIALAIDFLVSKTQASFNIEPTALDVYRGKTTLEITYRDSVAIDSTVVYKVK